MSWLRVTVEADASDEEPIADLLNTAAAGGGVEILDGRAAALVPEAEALTPGRILLRVYLEGRQGDELTVDLSRWPTAVLRAPDSVDDDWQQQWKAFFRRTRISDRFTVKPPWEALDDVPAPGTFEIVIEPGMSFGTGTHETTQLCVRALDGVVEQGDRVLDVGCGSGILSIAAAKLGASRVTAIDIDPPAIEATAENARVNRVASRIEAGTQPLVSVAGEFDVVVANILSSILIALAAQLAARVRPGGRLLLSGILTSESDDVADALALHGMTERDRLSDSEWACIVMERA